MARIPTSFSDLGEKTPLKGHLDSLSSLNDESTLVLSNPGEHSSRRRENTNRVDSS